MKNPKTPEQIFQSRQVLKLLKMIPPPKKNLANILGLKQTSVSRKLCVNKNISENNQAAFSKEELDLIAKMFNLEKNYFKI